MKEAELHTGEILEFPDDTPDEVIQKVVKKRLGVQPEISGPPEPSYLPERDQLPLPGGTYAKPAVATDEVREQASQWGPKAGAYLKEKAQQMGAWGDETKKLDDAGASKMGMVEGITRGAVDTGIDFAVQAGSGIRHLGKAAYAGLTGEGRVPTISDVAKGIRDDTTAMQELRTPDDWKKYREENPIVAQGEKVIPGMMTPFSDALDYSRKKYGDSTADTLEVAMAVSPLGLLMKPKLPRGKTPKEIKDGKKIDTEFQQFSEEQKKQADFKAYEEQSKAEAANRQTEAKDRVMDLESKASTNRRLEEARARAEEAEQKANYEYMAKGDKEAAQARLEEAKARVLELESKAAERQRLDEARARELDLRENAELEAAGEAGVAKSQYDLNERMRKLTEHPEDAAHAEVKSVLDKVDRGAMWDALKNMRNESRQARKAAEDAVNRQIYSPEVIQRMGQSGLISPDLLAKVFDNDVVKGMALGYKSKDKTILMPIRDFLNLAKPGGQKFKADALKALPEGTRWNSSPYLYFDLDGKGGAKVKGHEGRHRARELLDQGYTHMPVSLRGPIRWSEQMDPTKFDYHKDWPKYLEEEMDMHNARRVPFPVSREKAGSPLEFPKVDAAVVRIGGKEFDATNHFLAIQEAMKEGKKFNYSSGDSSGFRLDDGTFITRDHAEKSVGASRSEDMPGDFGEKAREQVEMAKAKRNLPYPEVDPGWSGAWRGPKNERGFIDISALTTPENTKEFMWGVHHAMTETKDKLGRAWDIKKRHGFSTGSWQSMTDMLNNPDNPAYKIANHVTESLNKYAGLANSLVFNKKGTYKAMRDEYHFIRNPEDFGRFKGDVAAGLKLEKDPSAWGGGEGKWSPNREDMLAAGFDPKSIPTWEKLYAMQEHNWTILEATAVMNGNPVPPRIPGQLPHGFKGQFNVIVKLVDVMNEKNVKYYSQYNFHNAKDLDRRYAETEQALSGKTLTLEDGRNYRVELERHDASVGGTNIAAELAAIWSATEKMQIKPLQKVLENIFEANEQGMIAAALNRNHVTMKGHTLERLGEEGTGALSKKDAQNAILTWEKYTDALVDWHVRSKWVNEVLMPLFDAGYFIDAPHLKQFVQEKQAAFFKTPDAWTKPITNLAESILLKMNMDPRIINDISNNLSTGMSIFYLTGNVPYYLANVNQAMLTHSVLLLEKSRIEMMTGQKVSLSKALWDQITQGEDMRKSLKESAEQGGYSDPVMVENIAGKAKVTDYVAKTVDQFTRRVAYNAAYHMSKQVLSEVQAREYAGRVSREVNVPYDPETGSPLAFGRMGALRPLTTFMTYQQHMLGMHRQQLSLMYQGAKQGKWDVAGNAGLAALSMVGINTLLYGLGGMTGMATYDQIAYWLSKAGYDFPSAKELGRKLDVTLQPYLGKELSKDLTTLGLASKYQLMAMSGGYLNGIDQAGAGSGPTFQISTAMMRMLGIAIDTTLLSTKAVQGIFDPVKAPTKMEIQEWAKALPAQQRSLVQMMLNNNNTTFSDVMKSLVPMMELDKKTYRPNRDPSQRGEPRVDARELRTSVFGTPLEQKQGDITEQIIARKTAYYKEIIKGLEQKYKEAAFKDKGLVVKELMKIQPETGIDMTAVTNAMMEYEADKNLTPTQRVFKNFSPTMKGVADYNLRQKVRTQQPENWKGAE
jgi:hypothetical protein